jgi:diketogulonate reductase-like aldo/keto reductase
MKIPHITRPTGASIPQIGFGLWKIKDEAECKQAVAWALEAGYRHFDTAQAYHNEQFVGAALKESHVPRKDVFITTKVAVEHFGHNHAKKSFDASLEKLQLDYVDLLLLHFPVTLLRRKSWKALEEIHEAGKAKAIGVSNYTIRHLEELLKDCKVKPAVNQVELHVFLQQPELLEYCRQHDIVVEAYSPLAHGHGMDDPTLLKIAKKHGKTPGQIMLRWCAQQGTVPLPKSVHQERIKENLKIFDFKLDKKDLETLAKLNKNLRTCWDPTLVP